MKYLIFELNKHSFGIDLNQTREVLLAPEITTIPSHNDFVSGVVYVRGHNVTVINLSRILGVSESDSQIVNHMIMLILDKKVLAVQVDKVLAIWEIDDKDIDGAERSETRSLSERHIQGVAKINNRVVNILDMNRIAS